MAVCQLTIRLVGKRGPVPGNPVREIILVFLQFELAIILRVIQFHKVIIMFIKHLRILLFVGVMLGRSGNASVKAEIIYSQSSPAMPTAAFSSQDKTGSQKIADNFVLLGDDPVTIRSLRFIGGYGLITPPPLTPTLDALPLDAFRITFLEDSGGNPGMPVLGGDFAVPQVIVRNPTGGPLLNGVYTSVEWRLNISGGVTLSPSTTYWLSITNNAGEDFFWVWARANSMLDNQISSTFGSVELGPWQTSASGGMFFELNATPIPEPSGLMLCVICTLSMWYLHQTHSRHIY